MVNPKRLLKIGLSIFAAWQIFAIFVLPNPDSVLYRQLNDSVVRYGNLFGFNTTWRFFSPNPLIRLFEYDVFSRDKNGDLQLTASGRFPRKLEHEPNREIYNRKMNAGMFAIMRQSVPMTLGAVLCRQYSSADTIAIYLRGRVFPTIEKAQFEGQHVDQLGEVTRQYMFDLHCDEIRKRNIENGIKNDTGGDSDHSS